MSPRSLSAPALRSMLSQETGLVYLTLLTIDHTDLNSPIRLVNNDQEDITSNGDTYTAFPFEVDMPQEREDSPPRVQLRVSNVDRQIVEAVRTISSQPTVELQIVTSNDWDVVEVGPLQFNLKDVSYDALVVEGELTFEPVLDEPYPARRWTPQNAPGLF